MVNQEVLVAVIQYEHHGRKVWVDEEAKGQHRKFCLCFRNCAHFKPNSPDNCPIAQQLFEFDVRFGMTTPVYECPEWSGDAPALSAA